MGLTFVSILDVVLTRRWILAQTGCYGAIVIIILQDHFHQRLTLRCCSRFRVSDENGWQRPDVEQSVAARCRQLHFFREGNLAALEVSVKVLGVRRSVFGRGPVQSRRCRDTARTNSLRKAASLFWHPSTLPRLTLTLLRFIGSLDEQMQIEADSTISKVEQQQPKGKAKRAKFRNRS